MSRYGTWISNGKWTFFSWMGLAPVWVGGGVRLLAGREISPGVWLSRGPLTFYASGTAAQILATRWGALRFFLEQREDSTDWEQLARLVLECLFPLFAVAGCICLGCLLALGEPCAEYSGLFVFVEVGLCALALCVSFWNHADIRKRLDAYRNGG